MEWVLSQVLLVWLGGFLVCLIMSLGAPRSRTPIIQGLTFLALSALWPIVIPVATFGATHKRGPWG